MWLCKLWAEFMVPSPPYDHSHEVQASPVQSQGHKSGSKRPNNHSTRSNGRARRGKILLKASRSAATLRPHADSHPAYTKAIEFLMSHTDYEKIGVVRYNTTTFSLDRMRTLLKHLGNPHTKFKTAHVAGTKGKGSTCHMLAAMLQSGGLKTGLYTSPHLIDMRERIASTAS